jgi:arylsulfatase A
LSIIIMAVAAMSAAARPPNFVVVLADDIGFECLGTYGGETGLTPRIDRLAAAGIRFDSCLATPMCTTSRAMFLSGKYNFRNYSRWAHLAPEEKILADYLQAGGYATGMAGKWHLGNWNEGRDHRRGPARMGFQFYLSEITGESSPDQTAFDSPGNRFWNTRLIEDGRVRDLPPGRFSEDELADHALAFFRAHRDRPFFYHFASNLAHRPMVATADPNPADRKEHGKACHFPAMVRKFDEITGRLYDEIETLGLAKHTVFLITSDNGTDNVWEAKSIRSRWRGHEVPGGKYHVNETGTAVPMVVVAPGRVAPGRVTRAPIDFTDFLPTLLDLAGLALPEEIDGISFVPLLENPDAVPSREVAFTWGAMDGRNVVFHNPVAHRADLIHAARDSRWRYLSDGSLYDVERDPLMAAPVPPGASPEAAAARLRLKAALDSHLASKPRLW